MDQLPRALDLSSDLSSNWLKAAKIIGEDWQSGADTRPNCIALFEDYGTMLDIPVLALSVHRKGSSSHRPIVYSGHAMSVLRALEDDH